MNFLVTTMTHSFDTHQDFVDEHTIDKYDDVQTEIVKGGAIITYLKNYDFYSQVNIMTMLEKGKSVHLRERDVNEQAFPYLIRSIIIAPLTQYPLTQCEIPF